MPVFLFLALFQLLLQDVVCFALTLPSQAHSIEIHKKCPLNLLWLHRLLCAGRGNHLHRLQGLRIAGRRCLIFCGVDFTELAALTWTDGQLQAVPTATLGSAAPVLDIHHTLIPMLCTVAWATGSEAEMGVLFATFRRTRLTVRYGRRSQIRRG